MFMKIILFCKGVEGDEFFRIAESDGIFATIAKDFATEFDAGCLSGNDLEDIC